MLLNEIFTEANWSGSVKINKHSPEGLFASGSAEKILKWLVSSHKDLKGASSALNFYINRAGKDLPAERKAVLDNVKKKLANEFKL